jgi:hypothetical protein
MEGMEMEDEDDDRGEEADMRLLALFGFSGI